MIVLKINKPPLRIDRITLISFIIITSIKTSIIISNVKRAVIKNRLVRDEFVLLMKRVSRTKIPRNPRKQIK